jgi:hypothetical protein
MTDNLPAEQDDRREKAQELWARFVELRAAGEAFTIDLGEALKEARDGDYHKDFGYTTFEALTQAVFGMTRETAYKYIRIVENVTQVLPADLSGRLTNGPKALPLKILAAVHFGQNGVLPREEIERLRGLTDDQLRAEIVRLGYDRKRMGGRGPTDVGRRLVSRNTHRDQSKTIILLKERLSTAKSEREEFTRLVTQLQEQLKRQNEILMSDDRTRAQQLQIEQLASTISAYKTSEAKTAAQKVDREAAIRLITELRFHILAELRDFRDSIHLPDLETAAWFGVTFDDIRMDVQQVYDFVASDALKAFSESGAPVPLEDAASALGTLTKSIRANFTKLDIEAGRVKVVGKPEKKA